MLNYRHAKDGVEYFDDDGRLFLFARAKHDEHSRLYYLVEVPVKLSFCRTNDMISRSKLRLRSLKACEYLALSIQSEWKELDRLDEAEEEAA